MNLWSLSVSFRLGLGFHALNNEGADGSNLMQPRRIDVGDITYDGISGEIVRRHILENFVALRPDDVLPMSAGLHPDRGPLGIRAAAKDLGHSKLTNEFLIASMRRSTQLCSVLDIGGFLAAYGDKNAPADATSSEDDEEVREGQDEGKAEAKSVTTKPQKAAKKAKPKGYVLETEYIDNHCADVPSKPEPAITPVKRESCFDVGWLVSEEEQDLTITQHSAFRDTAKLNSRYAQTMRSNIYGGVVRADLHRIGIDDHWYLRPNPISSDRLAITPNLQLERQTALINAIANFLAAPTGSRVAGWAPHCFLVEGAFLLTSTRTAPFISPIKVDVSKNSPKPVSHNEGYADQIVALGNNHNAWAYRFSNVAELLKAAENAILQLQSPQTNA